MSKQTGYLRTSENEALIALDKLNRRIAAIEANERKWGLNVTPLR